MLLTRRGVLSLLGATTTAAASGVSARDFVKFGSGAKYPTPSAGHIGYAVGIEACENAEDPEYETKRLYRRKIDLLEMKLRSRMARLDGHIRTMPPQYASKKSWSETYKAHVWQSDQEELSQIMRNVRADKKFGNKVFELLGITDAEAKFYDQENTLY